MLERYAARRERENEKRRIRRKEEATTKRQERIENLRDAADIYEDVIIRERVAQEVFRLLQQDFAGHPEYNDNLPKLAQTFEIALFRAYKKAVQKKGDFCEEKEWKKYADITTLRARLDMAGEYIKPGKKRLDNGLSRMVFRISKPFEEQLRILQWEKYQQDLKKYLREHQDRQKQQARRQMQT
jgi:hypothetical protein